jgi:isoleucyl-tRNA synthetase
MADEIICGQVNGYSKEWNINGENVVLGVEKTLK